MEQFPHLKFAQKIIGKPRLFGGGSPDPRTEANKQNRQGHSNYLIGKTSNVKNRWITEISDRNKTGLPPLNENQIPVFLQLNPSLMEMDIDFDLQNFGLEIISEEEDGFIIGASLDGLRSLEEKINGFISAAHGSGGIADLWEIIEGNREEWKPKHILSEELFEKWKEIPDEEIIKLEVSIAFDKPLTKEPDPNKQGGEKRLQRYRQLQIDRDDRLLDRESHFEDFIDNYGRITSDLVHLEDSFGCEIEINGKGLKDLVLNYPFVFEITEVEAAEGFDGNDEDAPDFELVVLPPEKDSPEVGVIDSGIMEDHKYIAAAIKKENSKCYLTGIDSVVDNVKDGGHGTRVAGGILYPHGITALISPYTLPCFIRNIRILDDGNGLATKLPAELMQKIVRENKDCEIFNLSVASKRPFRRKHMSLWAATLDTIIHTENKVFVVSAGNILKSVVREYLNTHVNYPHYLHKPYCRIANPGHSSFAICVGSINHNDFEDADWKSLGNEGDVSGFSRIGLGIWGEIKPDVVEFGGGLLASKNNLKLVRHTKESSPELIRSTLQGGPAYARDSIGTSYATPKVTNIVVELKKIYPEEGVNLFRALVAQGARLPNHHFLNPNTESLRYFGYGLPSLERVTKNSDQRITFYNTGELKAEEGHIYSLMVPDELRVHNNDYDILIEVTLAYTAKVRRTRQRTKSYLSTWLDWDSSKIDETFKEFQNYTLKEIEETVTVYDAEERKMLKGIPWKIRTRTDSGVDDINRNNSTLQKDWATLKAFELPKDLNFVVRGRKGWDRNFEKVPYALTVSIEVLNATIPIYEAIRVENEIEVPVSV